MYLQQNKNLKERMLLKPWIDDTRTAPEDYMRAIIKLANKWKV